ncbi:hypothetical protein X975_10137, partial [Stegodyphus mimosarum]
MIFLPKNYLTGVLSVTSCFNVLNVSSSMWRSQFLWCFLMQLRIIIYMNFLPTRSAIFDRGLQGVIFKCLIPSSLHIFLKTLLINRGSSSDIKWRFVF